MALSVDLNREVGSAGTVFRAALTGGVIAAVINVILFFIFQAAGAGFIVEGAPQNPSAGAMIGASIAPSIVAAIGFLILGRVTPGSAVKIFAALGVVFTLLSLGGVFGAQDTATLVCLIIAHLVAGAAITFSLVKNGTA